MKKILTSALCFALAATMLASCSSKKYDPDANKSKTETTLVETVVTEEEFEIPEEEKVYTVDLSMETLDETLVITAYDGEAEDLEIPAQLTHPKYGVLPVSKIGDAAFLGNETLKSVVVPEGVLELGMGAFESCTALTKVTLPESLTEIGENAFYNSAIEEINIPESVTAIGYHAFSSQLNPTPWYASLKGEKVIVGDGILLKCNVKNMVDVSEIKVAAPAVEEKAEEPAEEAVEETEDTAEETAEEVVEEAVEEPKEETEDIYVVVDVTDVKHIAYDAFSNPGAVAIKVGELLESVDKNAIFVPSGSTNIAKFLVPYKSPTENVVKTSGYVYEIYGAPAPIGNPFKWENNSAEYVEETWYPSQINMSFDDGAVHGVVAGGDPIFQCKDKLNIPAADFRTMRIRMKHECFVEKTAENSSNFFIQIFFDNGSGLSEGASVKQNIEQSSGGQYIDYTFEMDSAFWKDIVKGFRIDTPNGIDGEFWIDEVEFIAEDPEYNFNELLKPVTKEIPGEENPHKYKFEEDEELATAWEMTGFEYSYAPIKTDGENNSIHGILDASVESAITSPEINVPAVAYRNLIVRMRATFDEKTGENKDNYKLKVYFDNGNGFSEDALVVAEVEQTSGEDKIEYEFKMYENANWTGTIKQIKIVLPEAMGGEFWIDKVEFVPEKKLTRAEFISMLYEAAGSEAVSGESAFNDVVIYDKYCNAVIWATEKGLVEKNNDKAFYPDEKITAGEYAEIMDKYAALKGSEWRLIIEDVAAPVYEMDVENILAEMFAESEETAE